MTDYRQLAIDLIRQQGVWLNALEKCRKYASEGGVATTCSFALEQIFDTAEEALSKRTDYYADQNDDRNEWKLDMPEVCMICGRAADFGYYGLQVHEIASRAQAPGKSHARWSYLLIGDCCHAKCVTSMNNQPSTIATPMQLAAKALCDPAAYDRRAVCAAIGWDSEAITEAEVVASVSRVLDLRRKAK